VLRRIAHVCSHVLRIVGRQTVHDALKLASRFFVRKGSVEQDINESGNSFCVLTSRVASQVQPLAVMSHCRAILTFCFVDVRFFTVCGVLRGRCAAKVHNAIVALVPVKVVNTANGPFAIVHGKGNLLNTAAPAVNHNLTIASAVEGSSGGACWAIRDTCAPPKYAGLGVISEKLSEPLNGRSIRLIFHIRTFLLPCVNIKRITLRGNDSFCVL